VDLKFKPEWKDARRLSADATAWRAATVVPGEASDALPGLAVRAGAIVPLGPAMNFSSERPLDDVELLVAPNAKGHAEGWLYEDAGDGYGYLEGQYRRTRFVADAQLGGLAKYLRMLGFDTLYENGYTDAQVARISADEQRIVLSRDRALLMHKLISHGCYVRGTRPRQQLEEIVSRLDLYRAIKPFSRCLRCNRELQPVAKEAIRDRLPPRSALSHCRFSICDQCDKIYWEGSHWRRMAQVVDGLLRV